MPALHIVFDGDGAFADLKNKKPGEVIECTSDVTLAALPGGMESGLPSLYMRFDLPDGRTVLTQTSMALFVNAAVAFSARFPDLGVSLMHGSKN